MPANKIVFVSQAGGVSGPLVLNLHRCPASDNQPLNGPLDDVFSTTLVNRAGSWRALFGRWIGALNSHNASLGWWAYTSTAKNLLSSPLGVNAIGALAAAEVANTAADGTLFILGATRGQRRSIRLLVDRAELIVDKTSCLVRLRESCGRVIVAGRLMAQAMRVLSGYAFVSRKAPIQKPDICLLTYFEGTSSSDRDSYFGRLSELLRQRDPTLEVLHLAYVYAPYRSHLNVLGEARGMNTMALFSFLKVRDHVWALARSLREAVRCSYRLDADDPTLGPLRATLEEALLWDLSVGGYLHNLLAYRATRRAIEELGPRAVIYPYENKSLEKMMLLGLRSRPDVRVAGYQHSSITRRHVTLTFEPGEVESTPLPDKIITLGTVTRKWLEAEGHYPADIFVTGCALRQSSRGLLPLRRFSAANPKVLLALSSNREELVSAISFFRHAAANIPGLVLGVRPHPTIPITLLPQSLRDWVATSAIDFSGSSLTENLEWCDVVSYISSTVALEALMSGKPAIKLTVDAMDPDPILGNIPYRWSVSRPDQLADCLLEITSMTVEQAESDRGAARQYTNEYMRPVTDESLRPFLDLAREAQG